MVTAGLCGPGIEVEGPCTKFDASPSGVVLDGAFTNTKILLSSAAAAALKHASALHLRSSLTITMAAAAV